MKEKSILLASVFGMLIIASATYAATINVTPATTIDQLCKSLGYTLSSTPPPTTPPPTPPPPTPPPNGNEVVRTSVYITGFGYPDNTPPNSDAICCGVLHGSHAGGTGTYTDPITVAVGHVISGGKDTLDFPAGTRFYIPNLRRYFMVEDACGDGNTPQNGPCHNLSQADAGATLWLDVWVGGVGASSGPVISCEDAITALHTVIQNPNSTHPVVVGPVYNGACSQQYGEVIQ